MWCSKDYHHTCSSHHVDSCGRASVHQRQAGPLPRHLPVLRADGLQGGHWVGVELDRPSGKNDGSVKGAACRGTDCLPERRQLSLPMCSGGRRHPSASRCRSNKCRRSGTYEMPWCIRLRLLLLSNAPLPTRLRLPPRGATASRRKSPIYMQRLCFPKGDQPVEQLGTGPVLLFSGPSGSPPECTRHHCSSEPHHRAGDQAEAQHWK